MYKNLLLPAGLLTGPIIGAGMFALPFLFAKSGFGAGMIALVVGALIYLLIHLLYADLIVRSPGEHRFAGYAKLYLGRGGFVLASGIVIFEMLSVLTIYLILSMSFANILFPGAPILKLVLFWALASIVVFLPIKRLAVVESLLTGGKALIVLGILALGIPYASRVFSGAAFTGFETFFLPFAPALFALSGRVAIPSVVSYFRDRGAVRSKVTLRKAITLGTLFPAVIYALFAIAIVSLSPLVSDDSVTGLIGGVPFGILAAVGALGLISVWSAYIMVATDTKNMLQYDFKIPEGASLALAIVLPLLLYFFGFQNFVELVSFVGGIFLAMEGLLVIAMWWSARRFEPHHPPLLEKAPTLLTALAVAVFVAIIGNELWQYVAAQLF